MPLTGVINYVFALISYIGRVIAHLVPNFVIMATGVGRDRICLASFNSLTPKIPCYTQRSRGYLLYKPSYLRRFRWIGHAQKMFRSRCDHDEMSSRRLVITTSGFGGFLLPVLPVCICRQGKLPLEPLA